MILDSFELEINVTSITHKNRYLDLIIAPKTPIVKDYGLLATFEKSALGHATLWLEMITEFRGKQIASTFFRNYKIADRNRLHFILGYTADGEQRNIKAEIEQAGSITDEYADHLNRIITDALDKAIPVVRASKQKSKRPLWMTQATAEVIARLLDLKQRLLEERNVELFIGLEGPVKTAVELSKYAKEVVVDKQYLRIHREWYAQAAESMQCRLTQVETNIVVPVETAAKKETERAFQIRPKIWKHAERFLRPLPSVQLHIPDSINHTRPITRTFETVGLGSVTLDNEQQLTELLLSLDIDQSVPRIEWIHGGHSNARRRLTKFCSVYLPVYAEHRNNMGYDVKSHLSPAIHFGHISPIEMILAVRRRAAEGGDILPESTDAFIEELMIRRELACHYCWYNPHGYDKLDGLPQWAKDTIEQHRDDPRSTLYTLEELERGYTGDRFLNAAQVEMVHTGVMHGYMRMYWANKVIAWTETMEQALEWLLYLNDKYELDGRDPNGFAGVATAFGKHDRPFPERPVFGTIRFFSHEGLKRQAKFSREMMENYIRRFYELAGRAKTENTDCPIEKYELEISERKFKDKKKKLFYDESIIRIK